MGRKSRLKKGRKRSITEYSFEQDGVKYHLSEIHPDGTEPTGAEAISEVHWSHRMGASFVEDFVHEVVPSMPKKRIFLLTDKKQVVLLGFKPKLTEKEFSLLEKLKAKVDNL